MDLVEAFTPHFRGYQYQTKCDKDWCMHWRDNDHDACYSDSFCNPEPCKKSLLTNISELFTSKEEVEQPHSSKYSIMSMLFSGD